MTSTLSVSNRMMATGEATSGFDYLRIALAIAVLFWHSFVVLYGLNAGHAYQAGMSGALLRIILPMFFSLSGFLVASSLERTKSLRVFLLFRTLRILPALAVEVTLSALVIGPLVTTDALNQYFTSPLFFSYFWNVLGFIHYLLPGVFLDSPFSTTVNASLWTVPYELECYVALMLVYCLTLTRRPLVMGVFAFAFSVVFFLFFRKASTAQLVVDPIPGRMLVLCFLSGVSVYVARAVIPYSKALCALCAVLSVGFLSLPGAQFLAPLPVAYMTVWLGLLNPPKARLLSSGDYSYGIYLYGFVIQQCIVHFFKGSVGSMFTLFVTGLLGASLFACFSWHVIEKPALRLKRVISSRWQRRPVEAGTADHHAAPAPWRTWAVQLYSGFRNEAKRGT